MDLLLKVDTMLSGIYKDYLKLVKYLAVGVVGTLADWSVFAVLLSILDVNYLIAPIISYSIGTVINYILNRRLTFNNKYKKVHYQFASFLIVALIGLVIQELVIYGMVEYVFSNDADRWAFAAKVVATFVGFAWTFAANKRVTFKVFQ